jgi:hypothetical protein
MVTKRMKRATHKSIELHATGREQHAFDFLTLSATAS